MLLRLSLVISFLFNFQAEASTEDPIATYFDHFEDLAKSEDWPAIILQGTAALEEARKNGRTQDEAKICAQLTSTTFYQGDYQQALIYANRCHELAEDFEDPSLFIRALYLESAVYRALAGKEAQEFSQQKLFLRAVEIAEGAAAVYSERKVNDNNLLGKIYFNLGAAHADNPKGNLEQASGCYFRAYHCFENANATDDIIRTSIRLGKIYLLQKQYGSCQKIIDEARRQIYTERLSMQADYLEAQLKLAISDTQEALQIAKRGLDRAISLGAKEDERRFQSLMQDILIQQ